MPLPARESTGFSESWDSAPSYSDITAGLQKAKSYLPITQAGSRTGRSVRDNTFSLRTLMELATELEKELIVLFIRR